MMNRFANYFGCTRTNNVVSPSAAHQTTRDQPRQNAIAPDFPNHPQRHRDRNERSNAGRLRATHQDVAAREANIGAPAAAVPETPVNWQQRINRTEQILGNIGVNRRQLDTLRPCANTFGQDFLDNIAAENASAFNEYTALLREQQAGLAAAQIADADAQAVPDAAAGEAAHGALFARRRASPVVASDEPQARRELGLHAELGGQYGEVASDRRPAAAQSR